MFLTFDFYNVSRLEHVDELLRSARLAGYLYIRTVATIFTCFAYAILFLSPYHLNLGFAY